MAGIKVPGLNVLGSSIQAFRLSAVLGIAPEASVSRLIKCVRSGPYRPLATVPATVWQLMHACCSKYHLSIMSVDLLRSALRLRGGLHARRR